ncbi:MAG: sulfatase-like hydrolase/transferase [Verrucomicrobiota bacterium]
MPNVLFISMDDLNDWIGCLARPELAERGGHPQAHTPNIDRLAASGTLFTNAHCPASACNPSRTAIMTGLSPHTSGLYQNGQKMREILPDAELLPKYFSNHGYWSGGSGKLLHYFIDARSWDEYYPDKESENPFPPHIDWGERPKSLPRGGPWQYGETDWHAFDVSDEEFGGDYKVAEYVSQQLSKKHDAPIFLACGIYRPHEPWFNPKQYFDRFPLEDIQLPPGYKEDDLDDLPPAGKKRGPNRYFDHIREHGQWKQAIQGYLASIAFADANVGRVLDALDKGPNKDNTIVVLWSDHGWHLGEKQHWQKFTSWRAATRVPLIFRVPKNAAPGLPRGTTPGTVRDQPVNLLSLFPTLTDLAGLPRKKDNDGPSLVPLLKNPPGKWPHISLTHVNQAGTFGLSAKDWRYIKYAEGGEELYHIKDDPYEWTNLANSPEHAPKLKELRAQAPKTFAPLVPPRDTSLPKLAFRAATKKPAPPSKPDGTPVEIVFANERRRAVELFWNSPKGELKSYGNIAAGRSKRQQTRPGAVWVVKDAFGQPVGHFSVGDRTARAVIPEGLDDSPPQATLPFTPATDKDAPPASRSDGKKTTLTIRNNRTTPVTLHWIDPNGRRAQNYTVKGGSRQPLQSYAGHAFLAVDQNNKPLGHFVAAANPALVDIPAITIPNQNGAESNPAHYPITKPPKQLDLDPFYAKCLNLDGYLICASAKVDDYALREAAYLIDLMLANRPDIHQALAEGGSRLAIMGHREFTTDVPEHAAIAERGNKSADWWDRRARGLGGSETDPVASCGEENLLCFEGDPYAAENILIHEFAHSIHLRGLNRIDPTFDQRLRDIWKKALAAGLWEGKYPSTAHTEYFAEGVQSWFNNNRENDHDHNHVNTRAELKEYDPALAAILEEIFGDTELVYVKPQDRADQAHLEGYDYSSAPNFRWPKRLKLLDDAVKREAVERNQK